MCSGSACDGQDHERVLVRQRSRAPHRPAHQEDLITAQPAGGHQDVGRRPSVCPTIRLIYDSYHHLYHYPLLLHHPLSSREDTSTLNEVSVCFCILCLGLKSRLDFDVGRKHGLYDVITHFHVQLVSCWDLIFRLRQQRGRAGFSESAT